MLAIVLVWVYSIAIFYIYGYGGLNLTKKVFRLQNRSLPSFPIIAIVGAAILATLDSFLSLAMPLSSMAAVLVLLGGILVFILTKPWKNFSLPEYHPLVLGLLVMAVLVLLVISTHKPTDFDTALYHAQAIHWIESFSAVPGLANIHDRLAFNSSWLVLNASFSFAFLGFRSFHLTNSVITLLTLFYLGEGFQSLIQKRISISALVKAILFFLPLFYYVTNISSPGTDIPVSLLIWIVAALAIEKVENGQIEFDVQTIAIFILSIFAITVKLSAAPLLLFALLAWIQPIRSKNWRPGILLAATAFVVVLPWLLRNIILSGYLVFPFPQLDLFSFDWKYPHQAAVNSYLNNLWYDRFPIRDWQHYMGMTLFQWLPAWFHQLPGKGQKIFVLAALASPLGFLSQVFLKNQKMSKAYATIFLINYVGLIFWLMTAPLLRFGYGFLIGSIVLAVVPILVELIAMVKNAFIVVSLPLVIIAILFQLYFLTTTGEIRTLQRRAILPADYPPSQVQACQVGNAEFYCGKTLGLCNYAAFPCVPKPRPNVEMRGASLQDGFRMVQNAQK